MLTVDDAIPFLLESRLIDRGWIIDGVLTIRCSAKRNRNLKIEGPDGAGLLIKQPDDPDGGLRDAPLRGRVLSILPGGADRRRDGERRSPPGLLRHRSRPAGARTGRRRGDRLALLHRTPCAGIPVRGRRCARTGPGHGPPPISVGTRRSRTLALPGCVRAIPLGDDDPQAEPRSSSRTSIRQFVQAIRILQRQDGLVERLDRTARVLWRRDRQSTGISSPIMSWSGDLAQDRACEIRDRSLGDGPDRRSSLGPGRGLPGLVGLLGELDAARG